MSSRPSAGLDARVGLLASRQCGTFSRAQAFELGASKATIQRRLSAGHWRRVHPGVYLIAGAPSSWLCDVWCALLAIGPSAVVSHETALRLHGAERLPAHPLTFTIPHGAHAHVPGAFAHQIDDLRRHRVTKVSGLPVSTAARAVVEVAATLGPRRLSRVLDDVLTANLANMAQVAACLREVMRPGKPGITKLARILDARGDGYVPPQSTLERALFSALAAGGLPEPRRQFQLPGRGALTGLADAAYPDARLIIEADGRRWHTRIADFRRDRDRDNEAARVGWQTLRFVYELIVHDPSEMCATVAETRAGRLTDPRK